MRLVVSVSIGLLIVACGGPERPPPPSTPPSSATPPTTVAPPETTAEAPSTGARMEAGYLVAEGSPAPLACASDADCTYGGALGDDCCWTFRDMNAVVMSTAYRTWQDGYRAAHCAQAQCPSPPVPSAPPDCLFQVRCVEGLCDNACSW